MANRNILTSMSTLSPASGDIARRAAPGDAASAARARRRASGEGRQARGLLALAGYGLAAACLTAAWSLRDQNLIRAADGAGYWFGIVGASLMGLLLLYPARKRLKSMRHFGRVSVWFRVHMIFGIVGPVLIVLHSNFRLGSFNGRIALFATLVVAGSGIVGRYIYAKLHHGLYGRKATLQELRTGVEALRGRAGGASELLAGVTRELADYEDRLLAESPSVVGAFRRAATTPLGTELLYWRLQRQARRRLDDLAQQSPVVAEHRARLAKSARSHLRRRIRAVRKFAQFRAFQKLFSLWHVVHYPLFVILVIAVVVHVLAVHMY